MGRMERERGGTDDSGASFYDNGGRYASFVFASHELVFAFVQEVDGFRGDPLGPSRTTLGHDASI